MLSQLQKDLRKKKNPEKARILQRFFKTGPGEYGYGDKFLGVVVPELRKLSRTYKELSFKDLKTLIYSDWHEERLLALLILVLQYQKANDPKLQKRCYDFYVRHMKQINNWDLVDLTAHHVVGHYLFDKDRSILTKWAVSKNLWQRRISVLATFYFIRQNQFKETLQLAKQLLNDQHDLMHKSIGWMLREIGKRDQAAEETFLKKHYHHMPRTMLRYAIERFPENKRKAYLQGKV